MKRPEIKQILEIIQIKNNFNSFKTLEVENGP